MIRHHHRRRRPPKVVRGIAGLRHLIGRQHLVIAQQVKLVQPVLEARGFIIQTFCDGRETMSGYGITHAELKQLRFALLI